jgi:ATP-dependent DNA helicase RecG
MGRVGVVTVRDLLFHLPRRYEDLREIRSFASLREATPDEPVSARAVVLDVRVEPTIRRRIQRTIATLRDEAGDEATATWFGRRFIERRLGPGARIVLTGRVRGRGWSLDFQGPEFGPDEPGSLHAGRIVPVYRLTDGVTNAALRRAMRAALDAYATAAVDYLPDGMRREVQLVGLRLALEEAHFPSSFPARDAALRRLAFDELLALEIGMVARDRQRRPDTAPSIAVDGERLAEAIGAVEHAIGARIRTGRWPSHDRQVTGDASLSTAGVVRAVSRADPSLTSDQRAAVLAVADDLRSTRPMLRLLQGDVGSGKTAVAALALAFVADSGRQGALLAPTDLLARQHAATLRGFLEPLGHEVVLLAGSLTASERREALRAIGPEDSTGDAAGVLALDGGATGAVAGPRSTGRVVVGTHALLERAVRFRDLALVVIDEQHRFGVEQRDALAAKGTTPHVLLMTATPIPRTLGQVFYADLDVSDLHSVPEGRVSTITGIRSFGQLMSRDEGSRRGVFPLIVREVVSGHRAFVVVPLVEEDDGSGSVAVGEAAERLERELPEAARLAGIPFPTNLVIGTVHGQVRAADRDRTMEAFRAGEVAVLVGTTVVEVGVDVPEATVMVVLNADRFGLAQLHQLRGRVGRGEAQSYCILVSDTTDEVALQRLRALVGTNDGFALAEADLELRRTGDLLGVLQSGLPPLRVASLAGPEDRELAAQARAHAILLVDREGRLSADAGLLRAELESGWLTRVGAGEALAEVEGA